MLCRCLATHYLESKLLNEFCDFFYLLSILFTYLYVYFKKKMGRLQCGVSSSVVFVYSVFCDWHIVQCNTVNTRGGASMLQYSIVKNEQSVWNILLFWIKKQFNRGEIAFTLALIWKFFVQNFVRISYILCLCAKNFVRDKNDKLEKWACNVSGPVQLQQ